MEHMQSCLAAQASEADTTLREGDSMDDSNSSEQHHETGIRSAGSIRSGGSPSRTIQRRTIVKGAAWSLPVLAAAAAVPMAAASTPACATQKTFFTLPDSPSAEGITTWFVVPPKVTSLTVIVAGGAGGATRGNWTIRGGDGGLVTATIPVTPGETLDLVVGQGGASRRNPNTATPSVVTGGQGFGNGGDADPSAGNPDSGPGTWWGGAAGGAGSAISRGGQPLVVAGGGGGAGGLYGLNWSYVSGGRGGNAGNDGEANWSEAGGRMDIPGGLVGGAAAGPGTATPSGNFFLLPGIATTSPRDGAVGGGASHTYSGTRWGSGAGAGGGGYAGGGSGARGGNTYAGSSYIVLGAGGAGGTSYLDTASGVVGTTSTWKQSTTAAGRQGGTITIEWCA